MRVLVTGATGFIGSRVVSELLKRKHEVIATSIEEFGRNDWENKVKYIRYNLKENKKGLFEFFERPDLVIHLAWGDLDNFRSENHINIQLNQSKNFLKELIEGGLKDVCVIGTCLEYGAEGELDENLDSLPKINYSIAKNSLREFLEELKKKYKFNLKWVRPFYIYGVGGSPKSILSQLDKALERGEKEFNMSGGEQLRDYLPVEKVAEYIVRISLQNKIQGVINCCSGKPISIKNFVEEHLRKSGKKIKLNLGYYPYSDYEPFKFWGSTKKLDSVLSISK